MKRENHIMLCLLVGFLLIFFAPYQAMALDQDEELPPGLVLGKGYTPGMGEPVGKVLLATGRVVAVHDTEGVCFLVNKGTPLFKGDTLITLKESRAEAILQDASRLSLAPGTTLIINEFIHDDKSGNRSSFLNLTRGKARFWVKKLLQFRRSDFRVKTRTSIAGVRGSDFVILAAPEFTEITALENTTLAVASLNKPDAPPIILTDFHRIKDTGIFSKAELLPPNTIRALKTALPFLEQPPLGDHPDLSGLIGEGDKGLIPPEKLVMEDDIDSPDNARDRNFLMEKRTADPKDIRKDIHQILHRDHLRSVVWDMPDFPEPP